MKREDNLEAVWFPNATVSCTKHTVSDRHLQPSSKTTGKQHGSCDCCVVYGPDIVIRRAQGHLRALGKKQVLKAGHDVVIVGYVYKHCAVHAQRKGSNPVQRSLDVS